MLAIVIITAVAGALLYLTPLREVPESATNGGVPSLSKPARPPDDYVGSAACAECHQEISRNYQSHPMGQSLHAVLAAPEVEDYGSKTAFSPAGSPRGYRVEKTDEGVFHHELLPDSNGEPIYDQAVEVHYALGSGRHGRSYLTDRGGLFFVSPIAWYSNDYRWDLAPGYPPDQHPRFERQVLGRCLNCHAGVTNPDPAVRGRYGDPPFQELAIGCERCHGPGGGHVERHTSIDPVQGEDPIVNPARLDIARRESVCNQCHLQTGYEILRYGRSPHDFRPGMHLNDVWTVFVEKGSESSAEAVNHVVQMRSSVCYRKSGGELGCISCHDPHSSPAPAERVAFYRSRCLACHGESDRACALPRAERLTPPASDSCIHCHMAPFAASDIPHTAQTDHRILRRPVPRSETQSPRNRLDASFEILGASEYKLPAIEEDRAKGTLMVWVAFERQSIPIARQAERLLLRVHRAAPDDTDVLHNLAVACSIQNKRHLVMSHLQQLVEIDSRFGPARLALAGAFESQGRWKEAARELQKVLEVNPWQAGVWNRYSRVLTRIGDLEAAVQAAERAAQLDPSVPQYYSRIARLYESLGNPGESRRYRELFERISRATR